MYDKLLVKQLFEQVLESIRRIEVRSAKISNSDDFLTDDENLEHLDSIAMMLIAIGENIKNIDKITKGMILKDYPEIPWPGVKGVRDILAHDYFNIDQEEIFNICKKDIPELKETVLKIFYKINKS